jgi:hypothetical protein
MVIAVAVTAISILQLLVMAIIDAHLLDRIIHERVRTIVIIPGPDYRHCRKDQKHDKPCSKKHSTFHGASSSHRGFSYNLAPWG